MQQQTIELRGSSLGDAVGIVRAASDQELPADYAQAAMGLLPGDKDEYVVLAGGMKGQRGFFAQNKSGAIVGLDIAGRSFSRVQC
jgi:hypothetical protein